MGQKANPISLRLQRTNRNFDNCWYSRYFYAQLVSQDLTMERYITIFFKHLRLPSARISILYFPKKTQIFTFFCYPKNSRGLRSKLFRINNNLFFPKKTRIHSIGQRTNTRHLAQISQQTKNAFSKRPPMFPLLHQFQGIIAKKLREISMKSKSRSISNSKNLRSQPYREQNPFFFQRVETSVWFLSNTFSLTKNLKSQSPSLESSKMGIPFLQTHTAAGDWRHRQLTKIVFNFIISRILPNMKATSPSNGGHSHKLFTPHFQCARQIKDSSHNADKTFLVREKSPLETPEIDFFSKKSMFSLISQRFVVTDKLSVKTFHKSCDKFAKTSPFSVLDQTRQENFSRNFLISKVIHKYQNSRNHVLKYKNHLESFLHQKLNVPVEYSPVTVWNDWQSAGFFADELVYYLERRIPFRFLKTRILRNLIQNPSIRGIRITCSGRVGGKSKKAQRAKTECIKYGETCLHVFSSEIDFASRTAHTNFGSVGIKVWICYRSF